MKCELICACEHRLANPTFEFFFSCGYASGTDHEIIVLFRQTVMIYLLREITEIFGFDDKVKRPVFRWHRESSHDDRFSLDDVAFCVSRNWRPVHYPPEKLDSHWPTRDVVT